MVENIKWLGHAGFKLTGEKVVYIDPFKITDSEPADVIIITHEHFDHLSPDDIKKVQAPNTIVLVTPDCKSKVSGNVKTVSPGHNIIVNGIMVESVPAYNQDKEFHPKSKNWMGVVVTINKKRIYHAGDTDNIPDMGNLKNIDIALLPVSGTYVMTPEEAANAANKIMPKIAIPMHYGSIIGARTDAEKFKKLCKCKVELLG